MGGAARETLHLSLTQVSEQSSTLCENLAKLPQRLLESCSHLKMGPRQNEIRVSSLELYSAKEKDSPRFSSREAHLNLGSYLDRKLAKRDVFLSFLRELICL